ncbi:MAG: 4Fe-4S binding protein [Candidatus Hydrogenedentes bacterium]|nr:4Fe-4S binding protein [Candidatus Hydrogenedentota bacterium]
MGTRDCGHLSAMAAPAKGEAGETGRWRTMRPVVDHTKCTAAAADSLVCLRCWCYCPEAAIEKAVPIEIDLTYCKGCGICAEGCPSKAITMVPEVECEDGE